MVSLCIGIMAGLAAIALGIVTIVVARANRSEPEGRSLGVALDVGSIVVAVTFGLTVCLWGAWEIIGSVLAVQLISASPVTWVFWLACGLTDAGSGLTLLALGAIAIGMLAMSAERKVKLARVRRLIAPIAIVIGVLQIAFSIAYFLF